MRYTASFQAKRVWGVSMGSFTFLAPLALLGLIALPLVWLILRIAPPTPKVLNFPPLRLFADINTEEETPAKTPLWLLLFRLLMVALISFALAQPILQRPAADTQKPLLLVIDNSWLSAPHWSQITDEAEALLKTARRDNIDVALALTNSDANTSQFGPAQSALNSVETLKPSPWITPLDAFKTSLESLNLNEKSIVFLSSGLDQEDYLTALGEYGTVTVYQATNVSEFALPKNTQEIPNGFETTWQRPIAGALPIDHTVIAYQADNSVIARAPLTFTAGQTEATARFEIPAQLRSRIGHLRLSGVNSAGAVQLFDDSWGRPLIGILNGSGDTSSPLLSEPFYARTALQPFADIFDGNLSTLLDINPSLIVMSDSQRTEDERLVKYVEEGGVLVRFAGPKLAKKTDDLLPVNLRGGGRALGGALSWETPQKLAPFETDSPFYGLDTSDEITVSRQVMARPGIETDTRSWARLEDGSPIVTAGARGDGLIVLFHVTAGPEWSNLALSGLYVDMLKRVLPLAKNRLRQETDENQGDWVANRVLNGFGQFESPEATVSVIKDIDFSKVIASASTPPGLYVQGTRTQALQTVSDVKDISALNLPSSVIRKQYGGTKLQTLAGLGLAIGAIGLALDAFFAMLMSGRLNRLFGRPAQSFAAIGFAALLVMSSDTALAQDKAMESATGLHFAYIATDNGRVDRMSENGLESLGKQLDLRTTIDVTGVHSVVPGEDVLSFYPFLYWVVSRDSPAPESIAITALNEYMGAGGTIVFDTRDAADQAITGNAPHPGLARVTEALDIPRLTTVPNDHVLTKSFYLLQTFPGRYANGQVWVDANNNTSGRDGVSPVIIGGHDWASAWALDEDNRPLIDTDNSLPRQQEFAVRFGINIAMYALAGNYKSDQVHTAELVKRLGDQETLERGLDGIRDLDLGDPNE